MPRRGGYLHAVHVPDTIPVDYRFRSDEWTSTPATALLNRPYPHQRRRLSTAATRRVVRREHLPHEFYLPGWERRNKVMSTAEMVARPREVEDDPEEEFVRDSHDELSVDVAIEIKRLREVARYYCATPEDIQEPPPPPRQDLPGGECEIAIPVTNLDPLRPPELSVDPALTAFAQLGALKLDCDRSFISIIDHDRQYILAEATRSISLENKEDHKDGDAIYLGRQVLPLPWGVCPGTIQAFVDTQDRYVVETKNISANKTRYIIRNFMEDSGYRDRPYVAGWPFMRFYAEVPVHSPRGMVIGSYCVVDNKPRANFGDSSVKVLEEVAKSISHYLELTRMKLDYDRAVNLMTGLGSFVDNQRSVDEIMPRLPVRMKNGQSKLTDITNELNGVTTPLPSKIIHKEEKGIPHTQLEEADMHLAGASKGANTVASKVRQTFQRASELIRASMDLDGVAAIDAYTIGMFDRTSFNHTLQMRAQVDSETLASSGDDEEQFMTHYNRHETKAPVDTTSPRSSESSDDFSAGNACEVLGYAGKPPNTHSSNRLIFPAVLLHKLFKRHPKGHIFNLNVTKPDVATGLAPKHLQRQASLREKFSSRKNRSKAVDESDQLFKLFPQALSIIFFPLYDSSKNQWSSSLLGWTSNPRRGLQDAELTYLAAFSNSIIAELGRIEAVAVGQAKVDFIGNISHELRSPLHGILASAELLQESSTGANQTELISMVDSCGRTLLDTMNHLLDYAKINNFVKQREDGTSTAQGTNSHENLGLVSDLNLKALVEEVVEAMYTGHKYQERMTPEALVSRGSQDDLDKIGLISKPKQDVVVFLDIDERAKWIFSTEAGAWRRLIMNIFGNSLKYTKKGSIKLSMHTDELHEASGTTMVHLSVSDTGKGISKNYLKHKLYSPFSQEDSLTVGAGLGLSIVQQIVLALGGTIDIESEVSIGTTVMISIPLKSSAPSPEQLREQLEEDQQSLQDFDGVTVCLLAFNDESNPDNTDDHTSIYASSRSAVLKSSLKRSLEGVKGLKVQSAHYDAMVPADVYLAGEGDLKRLVQSPSTLKEVQQHFKDARLILFRVDTSQSLPLEEGVVHLSQPFGPLKLRKALQICLDRKRANKPLDLSRVFATAPPPVSAITTMKRASGLPPTTPATEDQPSATPAQADTGSQPHILLVDDNNINRNIMCTYLQKLQCTYATAADGLQALETYKNESTAPGRLGKVAFDLVLMDLSMPVMDGLTSTREIRAFEKDKRLPSTTVVALTGLASTKSREEATASGVNMYLTKPVQLKVLKDVLGLA